MNLKLQKLAQRLAHLAQMMSAQAETPDEADKFYHLVDELLALSPEKETAVQGLALSGLTQIGDGASASWLTEEFEVECALQHMPNAAGKERACLLFALPIVLTQTDTVETHGDTAMMDELHEVLQEADIINPAADFGLVTRLLSYSELFAKSYGQLKRLNRYLALQVMQGERALFLPEDFEVSGLDGTSCSPYADLYFIVGLAVTRNEDLEDIFPSLAFDVPQDAAGGFEKEQGYHMSSTGETSAYDILESGVTLDGNIWEHAFCETFDDVFGTLEGALTVLPPDGIAEDLRRGLELAREVGTVRMFDAHQPEQGCAKWVRLSYLQETEAASWYSVSCVAAPQIEPLETIRWPVLNHETEAESLEKLLECLADADITQESDSPVEPHQLGNLLLH